MPRDSCSPYSAQKYAIGPCRSRAWRRWNQWSAPFAMYRSNSAMTRWAWTMKSELSRSVGQSTMLVRTGIGLWVLDQTPPLIRANRARAWGCHVQYRLYARRRRPSSSGGTRTWLGAADGIRTMGSIAGDDICADRSA